MFPREVEKEEACKDCMYHKQGGGTYNSRTIK